MFEKVKIISLFKNKIYKDLFPQISIAREEDYFLQFQSYVIYLPSLSWSKEKLNFFEIAVLKLLNLAPFALEDLADKLCLKVDFAKVICDRLIELELLDSYNKITESGKIFLEENLNPRPTKNISPYIILVTRDSGEIFPKLFPIENLSADFLQENIVAVPRNFFKLNLISQNILIDIAKNFNRLHKNKIFIDENFEIPAGESTEIFLHIKIILQNSADNFFLVSDGEEAHNDFLYAYLNRHEKNIFEKLNRNIWRS